MANLVEISKWYFVLTSLEKKIFVFFGAKLANLITYFDGGFLFNTIC